MKQTVRSNKVNVGLSGRAFSGAAAVQERLTVGQGGVLVRGNVEGSIYVENKVMEVNADHGAIVNVYDAQPRVKKRDVTSHPVRPLRGFVNRLNELSQLEHIIRVSEVATVHGLDGMGKTALLKQAANGRAAQELPDGVLFMEGIDEGGYALGTEDVIQRLFDKSFESEPHLKVNFDIAQTYLSNLKPLVVFNGLNLPVASLTRMPDLYPRGAVLMESNYWIDDDRSAGILLGPLPRGEATELLAAKAGVAQGDEAKRILDLICALLSDVPLAIVIAARAIRENDLSLEYAHNFLASTEPQSSDANRGGIERAYALAHSSLTALEKQWLAAAALAPGISIDPEYLHQMAEGEAAAERAQERLQAMGLLTANSPRLRIHPAIRDLARSAVDEIPFQERFVSYLTAKLETRSLDWNYFSDEMGNIMGMIAWSARNQRWGEVISLGRAIDPYLTLNGLWEAWRETVRTMLQSARRLGDRANEAWALHQLGTHAIGTGWTDRAIDFLRQALDLRRTLGDVVGMAYTQHNLDLLIPPASPGEDGGNPPDDPTGKPSLLGNTTRFLIKAVSIGATIAVSGYLAVNALYSPVSPAEPAEVPVIVPTARPSATSTFTPTQTPTSTPSGTPTNTSTHTATSSPTSTFTVTASPSPTYAPSGFGIPQLSTSQVYFGGRRCDPNEIAIRIAAEHPAGIKVVVFFHRLHEIDSGKDSGWSQGLPMNPSRDGTYSLSVSGDTLVWDRQFTSEIWASYQFIVQAQNGDLVRSTVFTDLSLVPCGRRPPPPPVTITVSPTEPPPPIGIIEGTIDYGGIAVPPDNGGPIVK
jgi:hypothetical protein